MNSENHTAEDEYLTLDEVCDLLQICRSTVYNWTDSDPTFPRRRKVGPVKVRWSRREIIAWLDSSPEVV